VRTDNTHWQQAIVDLVLVQQQMREVDMEGLWDYHLPHVAASPARVDTVEAQIGESFPRLYREFLLHADGWPCFYHTVNLFGTEDLLGSDESLVAVDHLDLLEYEKALELAGFKRSDLLPIAATSEDLDLFVLCRRDSPQPGGVIWFAGGEIDRWTDFYDFFLSMIEYNRRTLSRMGS
jgi:SMI1 / KNR4 family (SUKH-1)